MLRPTIPNIRPASLWSRLGSHWPIKFFGITAFITVFFVGYFLLLRSPVFAVTVMPATAIDRAIPFSPAALILYFSLWFYVSLAPALIQSRSQLLFHGKMATVMALVGLGVFFFWPTAAPVMTSSSASESLALTWLKQVDSAGNACPSLHVAFAVFSGLWLHRVLREMHLPTAFQLLNAAWCLAIIYSTLATKQHVLVDAVAGGILGLATGLIKPPRDYPESELNRS